MCECVCVCVCVCVYLFFSVCVCVRERESVYVRAWVRACVCAGLYFDEKPLKTCHSSSSSFSPPPPLPLLSSHDMLCGVAASL